MKARRASAAIAIFSALAAGCTPSTQPGPTPEPSHAGLTTRDVCESLESLFAKEFRAVDVEAQSITDGPLFDEPIAISASCEVSSGSDNALYGKIGIRHTPEDSNPLGPSKANYVETTVDGENVLVFDKRKDPKWAMSSVEIATSIDGWFGELRIDPAATRTTEGSLTFTEEEQQTAARYLIETVRKAAAV
ncbi:hypothetical protein [Nocardia sp. X0981]